MKDIILKILAMMGDPDLVTAFHGVLAFSAICILIALAGLFVYQVLALFA